MKQILTSNLFQFDSKNPKNGLNITSSKRSMAPIVEIDFESRVFLQSRLTRNTKAFDKATDDFVVNIEECNTDDKRNKKRKTLEN